MSANFGLPGFADGLLSRHARRKQFGFLAEALRLFVEAFFQGCDLLETVSLHGAAPFA
jgi:hypothetical protein